jgi:hypothetical protein
VSALAATRVEGGLFGPDLLNDLATAGLPGQRAANFGLQSNRPLTDEIAATFQDSRALWGVFQHRLARLPDDDLATSVTRDAWGIPFLGLLGYELRFNQRAFDVDGLPFAISHRAGDPDAAPPVHIVGARQDLGRVPASGRPRMAPHSLLQEYLNRSEHVWGLVTNGRTLRLLRDTTFVRRQAYVEFDLEAIFEEQRFDDFSALFRLLHRSRLPVGTDDAPTCLLEQYYARSVEQGGRVREHLRDGVEECLTGLANGFLRHAANADLQRRARSAPADAHHLSGDDLYRQLLRIVYRFLFLLVSEERGLISHDAAYREHYGVARLRRLVDARPAYTRDDDLWQSLRVLWKVLADDQLAAFLGVAPLNGELFDAVDLDACTITNHELLNAFWRLSWYREGTAPPRKVNYAALDVEELGSVYESLLEFHPRIEDAGGGRLEFRLLAGSQRKTTGSYYTPPELVNELIQSALEPVIQARLDAAGTGDRVGALLSIRVCDPACGSGHFLLAAARRLGKALAKERTGEDEPAPERVREGTREAIAHCIYGVDRNPLAVDLCRVALWLESHTGGRPLTFLDHRIKCGDSLVGVFDLETLATGIPDKAFSPLEGDDRSVAAAAGRQNKRERETGARSLFDVEETDRRTVLEGLGRLGRELDSLDEASPAAVRRKRRRYESLHMRPEWLRQKRACNLWTSAFFQPLAAGRLLITSGRLAEHLAGGGVDPRLHGEAMALAERERFFHWPLEFPEVMADGGFDVVLSNPPWERVKLQEQEFFSARDAEIATAPTAAVRRRLITELETRNPTLHRDFAEAAHAAGAVSQILRGGGRFPLSGRGDINTYAVFAELGVSLVRSSGRAGLLLPTGIATDDTTKDFFSSVVQSGRLLELIAFENEAKIFPAVHHAFKFCKFIVGDEGRPDPSSRIAFFIRRFSDLSDSKRFFLLRPADFRLLNPNTGNCPIFRTRVDAELTKAIYRRVPVLWREATDASPEWNPWRLSFKTLFHMSNDSHHFRTLADLEREGYRRDGNLFVGKQDRHLPLYEGKMINQFDHRFSTYEGATESQLNVGILPQPSVEQKRDPTFVVQPRYWVREELVESAIPKYPELLADAVAADDADAVRAVIRLWLAGYYLAHAQPEAACARLQQAAAVPSSALPATIAHLLRTDGVAGGLQRHFPLDDADAQRLEAALTEPMMIANELLQSFSPKWFMGWRDITNATNERTLIASAIPRVAVGNNLPLAFASGINGALRLSLLALANSFVVDYVTRQKVGGTHINYFYLKQFPFLDPAALERSALGRGVSTISFVADRVARLLYTGADLSALAADFNVAQVPQVWDDEERWLARCELDAAFFHLYLPSDADGAWLPASRAQGHVMDETQAELDALRAHLPTPRDAVSHILDSFPIVRQKEEAAYGRYRTKERILQLYHELQARSRSEGALAPR